MWLLLILIAVMLSLAATAFMVWVGAALYMVVPGAFRLHGVEQSYRNICKFGRLHTCRVKDFRTEICQLGSLLEMKAHLQGLCPLRNGGRCCAFRLCRSDLYLLCIESRTEQGCGVVASATLEVVDLAIHIAADESLCQIDFMVGIGCNDSVSLLLDVSLDPARRHGQYV